VLEKLAHEAEAGDDVDELIVPREARASPPRREAVHGRGSVSTPSSRPSSALRAPCFEEELLSRHDEEKLGPRAAPRRFDPIARPEVLGQGAASMVGGAG